jgi:cytochrome c oxidase assembly protein subunit 15
VLAWLGSPRVLRELALASVVANVVIVVTGGAVRLTASGLGCPTWPKCAGASLTPTRAHSFHGLIEFTNRQLTFVLGLIAVVTLLAAYRQRRELTLAMIAFLGIPAQAIMGGITVLTHLNPWTVAAHFLLSMSIIAVTTLLWWRLRDVVEPGFAPAVVLARLIVVAAVAVLALGTVVTGTGPHAGDQGATHRIGLSPAGVAQLHADAVWVLVGLTVGLVVLLHVTGAGAAARRAAWVLLGVELAQGVIGYVQYFTHVPAGLVVVHMLGACLVWIAALRVLLTVQPAVRSAG